MEPSPAGDLGLVDDDSALRRALNLWRSFGAPNREAFELTPFWCASLVVTGSLLVLGPWSFVDDDPSKPFMGGPMFVVGLIFLGASGAPPDETDPAGEPTRRRARPWACGDPGGPWCRRRLV